MIAVSYKKFINMLLRKGVSLNELKKKKIISDFAYRSILNEDPVNLKHIDKICQYLKIPIEEVVEIIPDEDKQE